MGTAKAPAKAALDPVTDPEAFWAEVKLRLEAGEAQAKIGRDLGIDYRRVGEFAQKIKKQAVKARMASIGASGETEDPGQMKDAYGKAARILVPVTERIKVLMELLQDDKSEVRLRALEMLDDVSDIGSDATVAPALVPLFALPAGTKIDMAPLVPAQAPEAWEALIG
jgi:hypothetical protein